MNLLNKLERKFGKYAIPNLMYYVVILYAIGLVVSQLAPQVYFEEHRGASVCFRVHRKWRRYGMSLRAYKAEYQP